MATKNDTNHTCPICSDASLRRVRCSHETCDFVVTTCARCDRVQVVDAFIDDHEKDCVHGPMLVLLPAASVFSAPRRAA